MKNSHFLQLCYGFVVVAVFGTGAQQPPPVRTWDELKHATSTSVTSVAENCQKSVTEARNSYRATIDRAAQAIQQSQQCPAITSQMKKTVAETAKILLLVSKNVQGQLSELSNRFQKRLEMVINGSQKADTSIIEELKSMTNSPVDQSDQLVVTIQRYFSAAYKPTSILQQSVQQSVNGQIAAVDELKSIAANELRQLATAFDTEIGNIEATTIDLLSRMNAGMDVIKQVQVALKNGGQLPQKWSPDYIKQNLLVCVQTAKTCQANNESPSVKQSPVEVENVSTEGPDTSEQDLGCARIFERTKKSVLKQLIQTIKDIKAMQNVEGIDARTYKTLQYYAVLFDRLGENVNNKIIEFIRDFMTLYQVVLSIMNTINKEMKVKMEKIFQDQSTTYSDTFTENIQKYLAEPYLSEAKIKELHMNLEKSLQGDKSKQRYIKEFSLLTNSLGKDLEAMKSTTTYILVEMKKGVNALQNLKNKSNNTGFRYYFNYYTGETDLSQLSKLINIMNILNISQLIDREIDEVVSNQNAAECESISQTTQQEMAKESQQFAAEIETQTDANKVKEVATDCVTDYNQLVQNFSVRTRKVLKRLVINFVSIFENVIIIVRRKKAENVEKLEQILASATCSDDTQTLISKYLSENADVDVGRESNVNFESLSSDIQEAKRTAKQQIQELTNTMSSQLMEVDSQVSNIIRTIAEEAKNLQQLKTEVEQSEGFCIAEDRFKNIESIMQVAKSLGVSVGDTTDSAKVERSIEDRELEKCFENARQKLQVEKSSTENEVRKCTDISQVQSRTQMTVTNIREIISSTSMELRATFTRYASQFTEALNAYIQSSGNQQILSEMESQGQTVSLSEHLQAYVQDKYSATVLESYSQCVSEDQSIEEARQLVFNSLNTVTKQIETDMESVRSEATAVICERLKSGIAIFEEIKTREVTTVAPEELVIISATHRLVKMLEECMTVDVQSSMAEAENAISVARESVQTEYDKANTSISAANDKQSIEIQMVNTVTRFDSAYNTMRYCVKSQLEQCSSSFTESLRSATNGITGNTQVKTTLQDIMKGNNVSSQDNQFQKILSFMNSESYVSSTYIRSLYKSTRTRNQSQQTQTSEVTLQELNNLHTKVSQSIDRTEEVTRYVSTYYQEAINIIQSIKEGSVEQLTEENIKYLATSIAISKTVARISNNIDFTSAKQAINQEYQSAVKTIKKDSINAAETVKTSVDKYDYVFNGLRTEVMEKFLKGSEEFTSAYSVALETMKSEQNSKIAQVLQDILDKKTTSQVTNECQKFASYISSGSFTCTTLMSSSYTKLQQTNANAESVDQLKTLTTEITRHMNELESTSQFVNKSFHEAIEILQRIRSNTDVTQEMIAVFTKCITISERITECSSSFTRSLEEGKKEAAFTNAETAINQTYESAVNTIKTATDQETLKQTMSASVEKYDSIHNSLRQEVKQMLVESAQEFTDTFATAVGKAGTLNKDVQNTLIDIRNQKFSQQVSEKCTKFVSYINSSNFTSSCLMKNAYINLSQHSTSTTNDQYEQQLKTLTTEVSQHVAAMNTERKFINESLVKSIEILRSIQSTTNIQLTQEQITTLTESVIMSETVSLQCNVSSQEMEEAFSKAEVNITREYENAVSKIKLATDTQTITDTMISSVKSYDTIRNTLKKEVEQTFIKSSSEFTATFTSVKETVKSAENILQDIWNQTTRVSVPESSQKFQSYVMSESFASCSVANNLYSNLKRQDISTTTNLNEKSITQLQKLTTEVNYSITQMNSMRKFVDERFRKSVGILQSIETNNSITLTQEQITTLVESVIIYETITHHCNSDSTEENESFTTAERSINSEYDNAIAAIQAARDEETVQQIMSASIEKYDSIRDGLKEEVFATFTSKSSDFTNIYKSIMETVKSQNSQIRTVLQDVRDKKTATQISEEFKKCESFIKSDSFASSSIVANSYQQLLQQNASPTSTFTDRSVQNLRTLTEQVQKHLTDMNSTRKSINVMLLKGAEVLKAIETNTSIRELTQEQIRVLTESVMLSEVIIYQCSSSSLQEEKSFSTAQKSINEEYEGALKTIKTATDEAAVRETMSSTVTNYESVYNNLKEEMTQKFTEKSSQFSSTFESVMETVKSQQNSNIQSVLQEIQDKKINIKVSDEYKKSESYLTSDRFESFSLVMNSYKSLQQQNTSTNFNEKNVQTLKTLTQKVSEYITEMSSTQRSVNVRLQQATDILKNIESDTNTQLTQEHIQILTESVMISEVIKYRCTSTVLHEEKSFSSAQRSIDEGYESTLDTIKSATEETIVKEAMSTTVENYDSVYNNLKEEMTQKFTQTSSQFTDTYNSVIETVKSQQNTRIQSVLQDIRNKKTTVESEDYRKFESYLKSNSFRSSATVFNSYRNLQQQNTSTNFNDRSVQNLKALTEEVTQYITEMNSVHQSVSFKLRRATDILKSIERNTNVQQLTHEQTTILTESIMISEVIKYQCDSSALQQEKSFSTAGRSITEEYENALQALETAENEEIARQVMSSSVEKYDSVFQNLHEEVKQTFEQNSSQFTETFQSVEQTVPSQNNQVRTVLQDIKNRKTSVTMSEENTNILSYLETDYHVSSVKGAYENLQQKDTSTVSQKERCSQQLKTLTTDVSNRINQMNSVQQYVNLRLQQGTDILKSIEIGNVELKAEQIAVLTESINIVERVTNSDSHSSRSLDEQQEVISKAASQITQEHDNTLTVIQSATNEESVKQAMSVSAGRYSSTYNDLRNNIKDRVNHAQENYNNKFKSTMNSLKQNTELAITLKKIESGQQIQRLQEDKNYKTFESYINSDSFAATDYVQNIYQKLQSDSDSSQSTQTETHINTSGSSQNFKERGIQQLTSLTNQVNEKMIEMGSVDKYVSQNYQKSSTILDKITQSGNVQLTQEEINTLVLTNHITRTITSQTSSTHEVNFNEAHSTIQNECQNTINSIRSMKNEQEIQQAVTKNIEKYDTTYNSLRDNVKTKISQNGAAFTEAFQSTSNTIQSSKVQAILQDIRSGKHQIQNEQFQKFSSRINSEKFKSMATANDIYRRVQQTSNQSQNLNERSINELQQVSDKMSRKITEIEEGTKYAVETIQHGSEILHAIQQNTVTELNEKQITTLATCIQITNAATQITSTCVGVSSKTDTAANHVDFSKIHSKINEERDNTINSIRSVKDEKQVQQTISASVQYYDTMYNEVKQQVQAKITDTSRNFEEIFETTVSQSNDNQLTETLQSIVNNHNYQSDEKARKFETYLTSNDFKSASAVTNMYDTMKQTSTSSDINERGVEQVTKLSSQVTENINQMNEVNQYVDESLKQGTEILQRIQTNKNIQLTEQEKQMLAQNHRIAQIVAQTNDQQTSHQGRSMDVEAQVATIEKEVDIATAQSTISKQCDQTVELIKSANDETRIKQIVDDNVKEYSTVYQNVQQNVHSKMSQKSSTFIDTFQSTLTNVKADSNVKAVLQDIANGSRQSSQTNTKFQKIVSYIDSDTFKSTTAVNGIHESAQQRSSSTNEKERTIQQVQYLKQEVDKNIRKFDETSKYVNENLQRSAEILQTLQTGNDVELNEKQIEQLTRSFEMANVIKSSCQSQQNNGVTDISSSSTQKEIAQTVDQSTQCTRSLDEANVQEVADVNVETETQTIYDLRQKVTTIFVDEDMQTTASVSQFNYGQCQSVLPPTLQTKSLEMISLKNLMIDWQVTKSTNHQWPCSCFNLSWTSDKFKDVETKQIIAEISGILKAARNLVNGAIATQLERMRLSRRIEDILSRTTVCAENINDILSESSMALDIELQRLLNRFNTYLKSANVELQLQNLQSTLNQQFIDACNTLHSLNLSRKTDLLDLVDQQFSDMQCDSCEKSKAITIRKFDKFKSIMNLVTSNIDCLVLRVMDTIVSGESTIKNMNTNNQGEVPLESVRNCQVLSDIIYN